MLNNTLFRMRSKLARIAGVIVLSLGVPLVFGAGTALAYTQRADISFEGQGDYLGSGGAVGGTVVFTPSTNQYYILWNYQIEGSAEGESYYYLHPQNNNNLCMTASTTQYGVIKIENCVGASNQHWWNPNSGGYYQIQSVYEGGASVTDTRKGQTSNATLGTSGWGVNGNTFDQIP
jgi:hypothetical protein